LTFAKQKRNATRSIVRTPSLPPSSHIIYSESSSANVPVAARAEKPRHWEGCICRVMPDSARVALRARVLVRMRWCDVQGGIGASAGRSPPNLLMAAPLGTSPAATRSSPGTITAAAVTSAPGPRRPGSPPLPPPPVAPLPPAVPQTQQTQQTPQALQTPQQQGQPTKEKPVPGALVLPPSCGPWRVGEGEGKEERADCRSVTLRNASRLTVDAFSHHPSAAPNLSPACPSRVADNAFVMEAFMIAWRALCVMCTDPEPEISAAAHASTAMTLERVGRPPARVFPPTRSISTPRTAQSRKALYLRVAASPIHSPLDLNTDPQQQSSPSGEVPCMHASAPAFPPTKAHTEDQRSCPRVCPCVPCSFYCVLLCARCLSLRRSLVCPLALPSLPASV